MYCELITKETTMKGLILIVLNIVAYVYCDCPHGFEHVNGACYKVEPLEASWVEAKMTCRILGSELVVIEDAAEETSIEGMLTQVHGSHIDEVYWLSGADITNEADWRWFTTDGVSTPINYTNWGHNRPDNAGGQQNCLVLSYHGTKTYWDDVNCYERHSFICEAPYNKEEVIIG
ncbi:hypothetical protein ACF0H5_013661 [Mactra antiquata]